MKYDLYQVVKGKRTQHMGVYTERQVNTKKHSMKKKHPEIEYEFIPREVEEWLKH